MKDIQKVFNDCVDELKSIGIVPDPIKEVVINTRATTRWGRARRKGSEDWTIEISSRLLGDDIPDWPLRNTMIHEILHCVPGGSSHKGKWKLLANKCNIMLGTNVKRVNDYSEYFPEEEPKDQAKYVFRCKGCGQTITREKRSKFVRLYKLYRCGMCGNEFEQIK